MKKVLLGIFSAILVAINSFAYDFEVDDIFYNILPSGNEVEVTHDNDDASSDYSAYRKSRLTIPESVTYDGVTYNVVRIGDNAFRMSYRVRQLTLPSTITTIGNKAFYFCTHIEELDIPNAVTSIGEMAFFNCFRLSTLRIPALVSYLGQGVIMKCTGLTRISVDSDNAHYCCENNNIYNKEKSAIIAAAPTISGELTIPETVLRIEKNAFEFCTGITAVNFNENLEEIDDFAFYYCTGLNSLTLPASLRTLGYGVFFFCDALTSVSVGGKLTHVADRAFSCIRNITQVELKGDIETIGHSSFSNCIRLKDVVFSATSLSEIGNNAFMGNSAITTIAYPQSLTKIGEYAYANCIKLRELTFGSHITNIGNYAYFESNRIRTINMAANEPPTIDENTFVEAHYNATQLNVPQGCQSLYKAAAYWQNFQKMSEYDTAIDDVYAERDALQASVENGYITLHGIDAQQQVNIYSINGSLIYTTSSKQLPSIKLSCGVYIIQAGSQTCKVAV